MISVFLSHSSKDKFFARKLAETLSSYEVKVWIDEAELKIGDSLITKIATAIEGADFVAAILSHSSVRSDWVTKELRLAMTQEIEGRRVKVLPILIERCEIPDFLRDKLYADFTDLDDFDGPLSRLLHALGISRPTSAPAAPPVSAPSTRTPKRTGPESLEGFDDIRIVGVDKDRAYRPDPQKLLYHVYFELSAHPPQEWVQIFEAERQFPRHTMWRHAWVEGNYVVVQCVPEEVKKYHLSDIKQDVTSSNAKYREYLKRVVAEKAREAQQRKKMEQDLDDALGDLDLDQ
ncbi:MAG: toll/interleukin-1 receptor domain-containing protein [Planctomycetota bacterium]